MKVSVIVCTYTEKRFEDVLRCIKSLKNQTRPPDEILLVLDPIDRVIRFYENVVSEDVKIVKSRGFGLSNARNSGIEASVGDILMFIDDDAWADERWVENMLRHYSDETVYGVGGKIVPAFDEGRPKWLPEELDWIVGCTYRGMPVGDIRNPIGANMSFRRKAFEIAGYFRTEVGRYGRRLLSGEEAEFAMRLKRLKPDAKIVYDPNAIVYHRVPKSRSMLRYALRRAYYEGYSKAILSKEYRLGMEMNYLKFLVFDAIPKKLLRMNILETLGILSVMLFVALGSVRGNVFIRTGR